MVRIRFFLALAAMMVVAAAVEAQFDRPSFTSTPTPFAVTLLDGIDDPNLVEELKLSEDQVKVLVQRRQAVWDEVYETAPRKYAERNAARLDETNALLKKTLTAEQYQRAVQLGAQGVLFRRFGDFSTPSTLTRLTTSTFNRYPELVSALKLTDDQKKELTAAPAPMEGLARTRSIALTPEQIVAAKEFIGPIFEKSWNSKWDERTERVVRRPANLALLAAKDVRTDLQLTEEQTSALAAINEKWNPVDGGPTAFGDFDRFGNRSGDLSPKEAAALAVTLTAESEKLLATVLEAKQAARLNQIAFQSSIRNQRVDQFYQTATAARELSLTESQVKQIGTVWEAYRKDAAKVFETAESFEPTEKRINELIAARQNKAEAALTPEQAEKLRNLLDKPFTGSILPDGASRRGFSGILESLRAGLFGKYSAELTQLAQNRSIQEELKMTADQVKKAEELRAELLEKYPAPISRTSDAAALEKALGERSAFVEAEVKKLLSAEQAKRFREIMLQAREPRQDSTGSPFSTAINSAAAYPGVAEAIKLTDDQKKKLLAGTPPAEVLTDEQKNAIAKMLGEPFKGDFNPLRSPAPPRDTTRTALPRLTGRMALFGNPVRGLYEALELTPDQTMKISAAVEACRVAGVDSVSPGFGRVSARNEEAIKAQTAAIEQLEKTLRATLTADQTKRADQLALQSQAASNLAIALAQNEMAKLLGLSADQVAKLTALDQEHVRLQELLQQASADDRAQQIAYRLRDASDERMLAVLTADQKSKWNEQIGKPWEGIRKRVPSRFGDFGGAPPGFGR